MVDLLKLFFAYSDLVLKQILLLNPLLGYFGLIFLLNRPPLLKVHLHKWLLLICLRVLSVAGKPLGDLPQ